jgi:polyhydroxybutyrate depolymerase
LEKIHRREFNQKSMKPFSYALLCLALGALACGQNLHPMPSQSTDSVRTLTFGGLQRSYILHISVPFDNSQPLPLVFDFHGGEGNAQSQMRMSGFNALADEKAFIVVYPNGSGLLGDKLLTWNGGTCCGYSVNHNIDDVGFIRALLAVIESSYKVDPRRVYATGLSNGGIFSYRLACDASDLFAAIGPVSGTLNTSPCEPKTPVSIIHFHGTADQHVPYNGGIGDKSLADVPFTSVKDSIDFWVKYDECAATPQTEKFFDIQHDIYSNCANATAVELYTIVGGKHAWPGSNGPAWPGGDPPTQNISATELMWTFFSSHPKP